MIKEMKDAGLTNTDIFFEIVAAASIFAFPVMIMFLSEAFK
jgi:hypothetical protein